MTILNLRPDPTGIIASVAAIAAIAIGAGFMRSPPQGGEPRAAIARRT